MTEIFTDSWHSYPKVYHLGHAAVADILRDEVAIEEKVDGSQFSFGRFNGELRCRSKGAQLNVLTPEPMFTEAVDVAGSLDLRDGWTYRAEYLKKPKHNSLAYSRIPERHLVLFDVNPAQEQYLDYDAKFSESMRVGLEIVPLLKVGPVDDLREFRSFLDTDSFLGGQKIEGVVVKNYLRFGPDGKALMAKFVSESFKEVHAGDWKDRHPNRSDILYTLIEQHKTPARWAKAVQHLAENGTLEGSPRDIGKLIPECQRDIRDECQQEISEALFNWAWPQISRGVIAGLPEWYKEQLLKKQFEERSP